jgi:DNA-binding transcriptional LysR family regulator
LQTILCLVESGIGVALVPGVAARQAGGFELLSIGLNPDDTAIGLSMVARVGEISAATQNFRTIAREVCGSTS